MSSLNRIIESFLKDNEATKASTLGGRKREVGSTDNLLALLKKQGRLNNNILIVIVIMLCLVFVTSMYLTFYYIDSPSTLGLLFGGTFLTILTIVTKLQKVWREKNNIDILLMILPDLPPQDIIKVIEIIHYKNKAVYNNSPIPKMQT